MGGTELLGDEPGERRLVVAEFPGNGLEVTSSASNVTVTVSTGMYAGCSATLTPRGSEVVLEDVVCGEPRTDAPASEPVN
ncbi:MAG: hypothetical protein KJS90_08085 [Acidobacteria bacterium]|nr:hypothetical protein [Acidobacteriota bacterium]